MFKRLFNWIKFKTLPPSINFKNRLFLERDSKSRRITNNLGLTFRNSKWADYTRTDINLNLRHSYKQALSLLLLSTLILGFFLYAFKLYNPTPLSNDLAFFIWSLKDLLTYHTFTFLTLISFTLTVGLEKFYVSCVGWFFLKAPEGGFVTPKAISSYPKSQDLKYVIYHWFRNSGSSSIPTLLEPLLSTSPRKDSSTLAVIDLKKLFSLSNSLLTPKVGATYLFNSASRNSLGYQHATTKLVDLVDTNLEFLNTRTKWISGSVDKSYRNSHLRRGPFTAGLLNYSRLQGLSTNLQLALTFEDTLKSQLSLVKSNRLLYNYSFLHRKLLKNTHKLTTVKRLLGVNWYDSKLTLKNIWASDLFAGLSNPQTFLQSGLGLSYGSLISDQGWKSYLKGVHASDQSSNSFESFRYCEESLFWLMKRIYSFNNLGTVSNSLGFYLNHPKAHTSPSDLALTPNPSTYSGVLADNLFIVDLLQKRHPEATFGGQSSGVFSISFWENELLSNGDEYLLSEFTSSPTHNRGLLPIFSKFSRPQESSTGWALSPIKDSTPKLSSTVATLYVEEPLFSHSQDLLLRLFLTRK